MGTLFDLDEDTETRDDLPELQGTPRQLGWAGHVRKEQLAAVATLIRQQRLLIESHERSGRTEQAEQSRRALAAFVDGAGRLEQQTSCRFWLDRRSNTAHELVTGAAAKPGNSFGGHW